MDYESGVETHKMPLKQDQRDVERVMLRAFFKGTLESDKN